MSKRQAVDIEALREQAKKKARDARIRAESERAARAAPQFVEMPEPTGDAEADSMADLDAVKAGFRKRAQMENARLVSVTDTEYWFAVCFRTREQKERFLKALNWIQFGDKYLPGDKLAELMGVDLPPSGLKKTEPKIDPGYASLAM